MTGSGTMETIEDTWKLAGDKLTCTFLIEGNTTTGKEPNHRTILKDFRILLKVRHGRYRRIQEVSSGDHGSGIRVSIES